MTIEQVNTLGVLNGLLATCGGSHFGYSAAAADLDDSSLKALFIALGEQRAGFLRELHGTADRFGGADPDANQMEALSGKWKPLQDAAASRDTAGVLAILVQAENAALTAYNHALDEEKLMPDAVTLLERQRDAITQARDQLEHLSVERQSAKASSR